MSTSIEIWNMAMMKIGADRITAATVDEEAQLEAKLADTIYHTEKRGLLRMYPWNCAIKRAALARLSDEPVYQFKYMHALPDDCLRVLEARAGDYEIHARGDGVRGYEVEGRTILSDQSNLTIKYISDIDESKFDPHLEEALVAKLAFESVYAIGQSNTAMGNFASIFEGKLAEARTTDALENPHTRLRVDTLRVVRH